MEINNFFYGIDIFGDISRICIYLLLGFIVYMNIIIMINYSQSKKIIIENPPKACYYDRSAYKNPVDLKDLTPVPGEKDSYYYPSGNSQPKFLVSKIKNANSYLNICKKYCKDIGIKGCLVPTTAYNTCIKELKPPSDCVSGSKPLFITKNGDFYFAYSAV
jgi:hypothetical protein